MPPALRLYDEQVKQLQDWYIVDLRGFPFRMRGSQGA